MRSGNPSKTSRARLVGALAAAPALLLVLPGVVFGHPLGNFTINHYAGLDVRPEGVLLDVVIDMAEIPAFQERQRIDGDGDGTVSDAELSAERLAACPALAPSLDLRADGSALRLGPFAAGLSFPPGAGGLSTMRLVCEFSARFGAAGLPGSVSFADRSWAERIGWREIVATGDGAVVQGAAATSVSARLTNYPKGLLAQPLDMRDATIGVQPGGSATAWSLPPDATLLPGMTPSFEGRAIDLRGPGSTDQGASPMANPGGSTSSGRAAAASTPTIGVTPGAVPGAVPGGAGPEVAGLIEARDLTPLAIAGSILVAAALGALHAISPGHGKTVMAAYLVGTRGTARHAVALGLTVTVSHTTGVLVLAIVTLAASSVLPPERLYPILGIASGALVVGLGGWLLLGRYRMWRAERDAHEGAHGVPAGDGHRHGHDGAPEWHGHRHGHDGAPEWHRHEEDHDHAPGRHGHPEDHRHGASAIGDSDGARAHPEAGADSDGARAHPAASADSDGARAHSEAGGDRHSRHLGGEHRHGGISHSHVPAAGTTLGWRSLFSLGLAGGLVPSASALLLLLGSLAAHRPAYGLVLVVAFGAGMALVLGGIGLALVHATRLLERLPRGRGLGRLVALAPVASAIVVVAAGVYLTSQAVVQVF